MKRLTLWLALVLLTSMGAEAKSLVLTLSDGTKVFYLLGGETTPKLRFLEGKVAVDADQYTISGIKSFSFTDDDTPTAVDPLLAKQQVTFADNTLVVRSPKAAGVRVFSVAGLEVAADVQVLDGIITVNLNDLEHGAYVVRVGKSSLKVWKR